MRTLSTVATAAVLGAQTGEVFVVLLALAHAQLVETIRVTSDSIVTTSGGNTYNPFPFTVALPGERGDRLAGAQLIIDNVDRSIVTALRQIGSAPTVTISVVLASSPDTVEAGPFVYTLKNAKYNALTVEGDLAFEDILNEAFPGYSFVPTSHPGLY